MVAPADLWRSSPQTSGRASGSNTSHMCYFPVEVVRCGVVRGMGYAVEILVRFIESASLSANLEVRVSSFFNKLVDSDFHV